MALPIVPLPKEAVLIGDTTVEYRSLSRDEVVSLAGMTDDPSGAEVFIISRATGVTPEEATTWRQEVTAETADHLLSAIATISGITGARRGNA